CVFNQLYQLEGGRKWLQRAALDNFFSDVARIALFAIAKEHVGQRLLAPLIEYLGGSKARARFFAVAHVERLVVHKREAAAAGELPAIPPEVKKHLAYLWHAKFGEDLF